MNKPITWILLLTALLIIGCGGGGGGDTTGTTSTTATTSTTSTTSGTTGIQTGLYGRIRTAGGSGVANAVVKFYNNSGTLLKQVTTNANGNYAAELPTTATQFTIDASNSTFVSGENTYNGTYLFNQYSYSGEEYIVNDTSCLARAPTFASGQAQQISAIVFMERWLGPPPPPTGCLGG